MRMNINIPEHCENPEAYVRAAEARIRNNAAKARRAKWMAMPDAQRVLDFLIGDGEFDSRPNMHPMRRAVWGSFAESLHSSVIEFGGLSEKQHEAALKLLARAAEKVAQWGAKRKEQAAIDAGSKHVGEVGKRQDWRLTVEREISYESEYGTVWIYLMRDIEGNVIVYKGRPLDVEKGQTIYLKGTVKEHSVRDGVNQTILSRPAIKK